MQCNPHVTLSRGFLCRRLWSIIELIDHFFLFLQRIFKRNISKRRSCIQFFDKLGIIIQGMYYFLRFGINNFMLLFSGKTCCHYCYHYLIFKGRLLSHTHDNIGLITCSHFYTISSLALNIFVDFADFIHGNFIFSIENQKKYILCPCDAIIIEQR